MPVVSRNHVSRAILNLQELPFSHELKVYFIKVYVIFSQFFNVLLHNQKCSFLCRKYHYHLPVIATVKFGSHFVLISLVKLITSIILQTIIGLGFNLFLFLVYNNKVSGFSGFFLLNNGTFEFFSNCNFLDNFNFTSLRNAIFLYALFV